MTIYAKTPLFVIAACEDDNSDSYAMTCFPKPTQERLTQEQPDLFSFVDIPSDVVDVVKLFQQNPILPAEHLTSLEALLQNTAKIAWYNTSSECGSIDMGEWNTTPHLWLKLQQQILTVTIEHQAKNGRTTQLSGRGDAWLQSHEHHGFSWFQRDLKQEVKYAKQLSKKLGLKPTTTMTWVLPMQDAIDFIGTLSTLDDVPMHWHATSKQIKVINHSDFEINISKKQNWFSVAGQVNVDKSLEIDLRQLLAASRTGYISTNNDAVAYLLSAQLKQQLRLLDSLLDSLLDDDQQVSNKMAYPLQKLVDSMSHRGDQAWLHLLDEWRVKPELSPALLQPLRDYQVESVQWAAHLAQHGFGACLAGDMGLGKTLQGLTLLQHFADQGPSLVVCPKSVLQNWHSEAARLPQG